MTATESERERIVLNYRYLCRRGARKFIRVGVERCDLEQVAVIGLIKACDRYDPQSPTPFEAYAWLMIVGELMHYVRDHEHLIRIPRSVRALERRYRQHQDRLTVQLGRDPTAEEIRRELGVPIGALSELCRATGAMAPFPLEGYGSGLAARQGEPTSERAIGIDDRILLHELLNTLPQLERKVLIAIDVVGLKGMEVAAALGISVRHVSRLHQIARSRLRARMAGSTPARALPCHAN